MASHIAFVKGKQLGILKDPIQFLQNGIAGLGRIPIDRTFVTVYNHGRASGGKECLGGHPFIPSVAHSIQLMI